MMLQVRINENDYDRVILAIKPLEKTEESVLKTAVNNTARRARTQLVSRATKRYAGKDVAGRSALMQASDIQTATTSDVRAILYFKSPMNEIGQFHVSSLEVSKTAYNKNGKRRKKNIKGNVLNGPSKKLNNAFVVQFKSGHKAVVSRENGINMKKYAGKPKIPHYEKLKKLLSPNVPEMISNAEVYKPDEIGQILHEEVNKLLVKVSGG